jgi:hypothetical protein
MVRDSFAMPENDYAKIADLKKVPEGRRTHQEE